MGSQGNSLSYNNLCIAENEAQSPWRPFHVEKGFRPEESVVSLFHGWSIAHGMGVRNIKKRFQEQISSLFSIFNVYSSTTSLGGALVLMDPLVAEELKETEGFDTKEKLSQWLYDNSLVNYDDFWNNEIVIAFTRPLARQGVEPFASRLKLSQDALIPRFPSLKSINIIVVGGEQILFGRLEILGI